MDKIYFFTEAGKKNRIFCSHVSATNYHCNPVLVKSSVTGSTVGNSKTAKVIFSRNIQLPMLRPKCKDQCFCLVFMLFCADCLNISGNIFQRKDLLALRFQSQFPGMLPEGFSQIHT